MVESFPVFSPASLRGQTVIDRQLRATKKDNMIFKALILLAVSITILLVLSLISYGIIEHYRAKCRAIHHAIYRAICHSIYRTMSCDVRPIPGLMIQFELSINCSLFIQVGHGLNLNYLFHAAPCIITQVAVAPNCPHQPKSFILS